MSQSELPTAMAGASIALMGSCGVRTESARNTWAQASALMGTRWQVSDCRRGARVYICSGGERTALR